MPRNPAQPDSRDVANSAGIATDTIQWHHVYPAINNDLFADCEALDRQQPAAPDTVGDTVRRRGRSPKPPVARVCEHCHNGFSLTSRQASKHAGRFCSPDCSNAYKRGRPAPGFTTPESDKRQRIAANGLVNKRLKLGWFTKPTRCMKCGKVAKLDSHHENYQKPEEVWWLCRSDHVTTHRVPGFLKGIPPFICDDKRSYAPARPSSEIGGGE